MSAWEEDEHEDFMPSEEDPVVDQFFEDDVEGDLMPLAESRDYNYPDGPDVRYNNIYGFADQFTGGLDLPSAAAVQALVVFDSGTQTGTYDPVTGQYTDPGVANVKHNETYIFAGTVRTGTYDPGTLVYTNPGVSNVRKDVVYYYADERFEGELVAVPTPRLEWKDSKFYVTGIPVGLVGVLMYAEKCSNNWNALQRVRNGDVIPVPGWLVPNRYRARVMAVPKGCGTSGGT